MAHDLVRIDSIRNVHRFYRLDVQPDLFGQVSLIREWGRIGQRGTVRIATFTTEVEARVELIRTLDRKRRRGYCAVLCPLSEGHDECPAGSGTGGS